VYVLFTFTIPFQIDKKETAIEKSMRKFAPWRQNLHRSAAAAAAARHALSTKDTLGEYYRKIVGFL